MTKKNPSPTIANAYPLPNKKVITYLLKEELKKFQHQIIVLDDDPTGTQTVHSVSVFTNWSLKSLRKGFNDSNRLFYILTNSRSMSPAETEKIHQEIAKNILTAAEGRPFLIVSRSDSTLRGHYPLETLTLKKTLETESPLSFDGEIICPFFLEGGRLTINNHHYLATNTELIPVAETEFAKDLTFGYQHSNLEEWLKEKTSPPLTDEQILSFDLATIRQLDFATLSVQLTQLTDFKKLILNAVLNEDIAVAVIIILRSLRTGKNFLFRTAASFPQILAGITDHPLLTASDLLPRPATKGGLIIVGSHTDLTTKQLAALLVNKRVSSYLLETEVILDPLLLAEESQNLLKKISGDINRGQTVLIYTSRTVVNAPLNQKQTDLEIALLIGNALTELIENLEVIPAYLITKGGITSSDILTKALIINHATVRGQIKPGIPVWQSVTPPKFNQLPCIIFPGNVGHVTTLDEIVKALEEQCHNIQQ